MIISVPKPKQAEANAACLALFGAGADLTFTVPWINPGGQVVHYGAEWALLTDAEYDLLKAACPSVSRHTGTPDEIMGGLGVTYEPYPPA
jgi:hypothetical protein